MARLKFKNQVPPSGGWVYVQKESMLSIHGESFGDLVANVIRHRTHKGFDPKDADSVSSEVENQICARLGNEWCKGDVGDGWVPVPSRSVVDLDTVKAGTAAIWEWMKQGGKLVPIEEARRRSEICLTCPANSDAGQGCMKCSLNKIVVALLPSERRFFGLRTCLHCGCDLRSAVNAPESVIVASNNSNPVDYPDHCWKAPIVSKSLPPTV